MKCVQSVIVWHTPHRRMRLVCWDDASVNLKGVHTQFLCFLCIIRQLVSKHNFSPSTEEEVERRMRPPRHLNTECAKEMRKRWRMEHILCVWNMMNDTANREDHFHLLILTKTSFFPSSGLTGCGWLETRGLLFGHVRQFQLKGMPKGASFRWPKKIQN